MRRKIVFIAAALVSACLAGSITAGASEADMISVYDTREEDRIPSSDLKEARREAYEAYREAALLDGSAEKEIEERVMHFGDVSMRYTYRVIGTKPENGYPMYIALHGGGQSDTPAMNDSQWRHMQRYYDYKLRCGIYVAVRGVRDTWDTHFNPESYPLYDRLIQNFILLQDVDPNRVYLEGFSAGGDGVYAISPRMADRFAAVNMSAGHPNGVSFFSMKNLPIQLQVGEYDDAYDRNTVTVDYDDILNELQDTYGGYEHRTLVHADCGHNFADSDTVPIPVMVNPQAWRDENDRSTEKVDSFPASYMDAFTRNPLPQEVFWDLSVRAQERSVESFYYLSAPMETSEGTIKASYNHEENCINVETEGLNGDFRILLNEEMVDFGKPLTVRVNGVESTVTAVPSRTLLEETTAERGDPNYQFESMISIDMQAEGE